MEGFEKVSEAKNHDFIKSWGKLLVINGQKQTDHNYKSTSIFLKGE